MGVGYDQTMAIVPNAAAAAELLHARRDVPSPCPVGPHQGEAGTSTGLNLVPGSDDDGWIVPHPVHLADGTRVQLYKDGEALRAAFAAIKHAKKRICLEVYIFADDDTGHAFAELLCEKALAG